MGKYIGHITEIIDQTDYKIDCVIETSISPNPITFSGFPISSETPLTPSSPVYIEGDWSQHKKLGSVIKGIIRHIDSKVLPRIKKVTYFDQEKFLADLNYLGVNASRRENHD